MNHFFTKHLRLLTIVLLLLVCTMGSEAISLSNSDLTHSTGNSNVSTGVLSNTGLRFVTLGAWHTFMPSSKFAGIIVGGSVTNVKCHGETTGNIILSVSGGTSPYTYLWSNGYKQSNPHSLAAGPFAVTVTDATGLSATQTFTVTQPTEIIAYIECTPVCFGACNGTAAIVVSGGTPGYTYSWSGPNGFTAGNVSAISGLCGGLYWVTITDVNGCIKIDGGRVCKSPQIVITGVTTNPTCFGSCNGSIAAHVTEMPDTGTCVTQTLPLVFAWSGPNGYAHGNDSTISGLCPGTYFVTVTNRRGCTSMDTFHITQPDSLHVTASSSNATCFGSCNGTATVTASGGTPDYTISWAGSNVSSLSRTGLCAGSYCFTVTDANSCSRSSCVTITQPDSIHLTLTSDANCLTLADSAASLTAVATGGTGAFTYSWSGPDGFTASGSTILIDSAGVTYHVTATDANGCSKVDSISTPSCSCPTGTLTITGPDSVCFNSLPISLTAHSSLPALSYTWSGPNGFTSSGATDSVISVSASGIYSVTVVFGPTVNCTATASDTIIIKSQPLVTVDSTNILCRGTCSGAIALTVANVTGFTTTWTGPAGFVSSDTTLLTGLCAGTYCYTVDANGCTSTGCVNIVQPDTELTVIPSFSNVTCFNACNGSASVAISGGTRPYSVAWDHSGLSGAQVSGLCAGTYCFTVTDGNGCLSSGCLSIAQPDSLSVSSSSANATCFGSCNGTATVSVSGGTPDYTISWAGSTSTSLSREGLCAGTYCFTVTDANGCTSNGCVTITQPTEIIAFINCTPVCFGQCNGTAILTASGGTPPYTFSWTGPNGFTAGNVDTLSGLCPGNYFVTVTDSKGCIKITESTVCSNPQIVISADTSNATCFGVCSGSISLTVSHGDSSLMCTGNACSGVTFAWSGPNGFTSTNGALTQLCAGTYTVTVTDCKGCTAARTFNITQPDSLIVSNNSTNVTCFGSCNGTATVVVSGGTPDYTISWADNASASLNRTDLCAGNYFFTVTDANGCSKIDSLVITQPDSLVVTDTSTNVTCFGSCNGTATVTVSGGTPGYTISWAGSSNTTLARTGLCAGTYSFTVTDANGCNKNGSVTITQPDSLLITSTTTDVTCFGSCNGVATVSVSGGSSPYTITWANNSTTNFTRRGLCAGTYCFTITDAAGCTRSSCVTITQPTEIIAFINCTPVCFGQCNGTAILTASGGTPPYTFSWTGPNGFTAGNVDTLSGLCPGNYFVTVTDSKGCIKITESTVCSNPQIVISADTSNATCFGVCSGSISLTVSHGDSSLMCTGNACSGVTFAWSGPNGFTSTNGALTQLCAGTYTVTVTDCKGCTAARTFNITQPDSLIVSNNSTNVTCFGSCNGTATVVVSGGTPDYTISWAGSNVNTLSRTGLCAGTYSFTVNDANGCSRNDSVTVTQPDSLLVTSTNTNVACFGSCNGTATVVVGGGTPGYTISWAGSNDTTLARTGLCAGTYSFTITDANGCSKSDSITITQPDSLVVSATGVNATCFGSCNGTATVAVSGGTPGYIISWAGSRDTTLARTGLCAGTYSFTVTDANGCSKADSVTITQSDSLIVSDSSTNVTCFGSCNGTVTVTVSGGASPFTISWAGSGDTTLARTGLCAGAYSFTVTDANGCSKNDSLVITQPDSLSVSNLTNNTSCFGSCDGNVLVNVSGGTPGYSITWADTSLSGFIVENLCAGTYCYTVTDTAGCTKSSCFTITQPDSLHVTVSQTNPTCFGECNGTITVTVSGGTTTGADGNPYTITWDSVNVSGFTPTGLCPGTYCFTVSDVNGCSRSSCITITPGDSLHIGITHTDLTCSEINGPCDGTISLTVSGGTAPYSITWSDNLFGATGPIQTDLCPDTYCFTVTDASGCSKTGCVTIGQPPVLVVASNCCPDEITCHNACDGKIKITVFGGVPPFTYSWSGPNGFTSSDSDVFNLCPGMYMVTVTDKNGCTYDNTHAPIINPDSIVSNISSTVNTNCNPDSCNGTATVNPTGGSAPFTFVWSNGGTTATITGLCAGTYRVTITDNGGCVVVDSARIFAPSCSCPNITADHSNIPCFGGTGSITLHISKPIPDGTTITLYGPGGVTTVTDTLISGLVAGNYCYVVRSSNPTCVDSACLTITQPDSLSVTATSTNSAPCSATCTGTATVSVSGGTPSYTISWNNANVNGFTPTGLCMGTYCFTVTDANGCNKTGCVTIEMPAGSLQAVVSHTNSTCFGSCNGSATVTVSGGTPSYTIVWDSTAVSGFTPTGLCPGTYCFTVTDSTGCATSNCVTITQPDSLSVTATSTNSAPCSPTCTGTATVSVSGGTPSYTISWNNANVTGFTPTGLCAGTYCFTVTDVNGCSRTGCVTISVPSGSLDVTVTHTDLTCNEINGPCDGTINLSISGGVAPYTISWGGNLFGSKDSIQSNLCPDTYCFTVTDANGCSQTGCVTITQPPMLLVGSNCCPDNITCHNACNGMIDITVFGGVPPFTYSWTGPSGFTSSDSDLTGLCAGMYTVTVTDKNGCTYDHTHAPLINPDSITSNITGTDNTNCNADSCNGTASVDPTGGRPPFRIMWSNAATTSTISGLCAGMYVATITDIFGCVAVDSVNVFAPGCGGIFAMAPVDGPRVSVFPNPFTAFTTINFMSPKDDNVTLEMFSMTGVKITQLFKGDVKAGVTNTVTYTNRNLAEGLYFYRFYTNGKVVTGNMIIVH